MKSQTSFCLFVLSFKSLMQLKEPLIFKWSSLYPNQQRCHFYTWRHLLVAHSNSSCIQRPHENEIERQRSGEKLYTWVSFVCTVQMTDNWNNRSRIVYVTDVYVCVCVYLFECARENAKSSTIFIITSM